MHTTTNKVVRLVPGVQSYDWGIRGAGSRVAQFASATPELAFQPEQGGVYAELWMGTHASLPSRLTSGDQLSEFLAKHPEMIGESVNHKFGNDDQEGCLPFLFKVLSVGKALSIQAHPDKELARRLHEQRPDVYKDANHKPEMAIALTPFRGFCGFRPLSEIVAFVEAVPELAQLVQLSQQEMERASEMTDETQVKAMLKKMFSNLMTAKAERYEPLAEQLARRFAEADAPMERVGEVERKLVLKLSDEFPKDVGIFCTFLLNVSSLSPGEALFLQANEPHAYLEGEILECMASSDNVVRAGLTPKLRDTDTLISMCTYQSGADRGRLEPTQWSKSQPTHVEALLYDPPIDEFSVVVTKLAQGGEVKNQAVDGPSILLVLEGEVEVEEVKLIRGQLAFVAAGCEVVIRNVGERDVGLARAFVEVAHADAGISYHARG